MNRCLSSTIFVVFIFSLISCSSGESKPVKDIADKTAKGSKIIASVDKPGPPEPVDSMALPDFEIVDEEIYDEAIKTQVEQHIVVTGEITEENLRALLKQQYESIMGRGGFKHHEKPTNVYIYIYDTEEQAKSGAGLWLAMLQMGPINKGKPKIDVKPEQIANIGKEPEEKYGLSESERKEAFTELIRCGDNAMNKAMERYPSDIDKQLDYEDELREKCEDALAEKFGITREQLDKIGIEGVTKQWPWPKL